MLKRYELAALTERLLRAKPHDDPSRAAFPDEEPPRAAVAIVLREPRAGEEVEVLFIRRAERAGDPWSGHIAFPGGRIDPGDTSLLATAVRETFEEVGLRLDENAQLLARLPDMAARARGKRLSFSIAPFVFTLARPDVALALDDREVAEAIWAPLGSLARGEARSTHKIEYESERYELPSALLGPHVLWGLTFAMLESLLGAIHDEGI